MVSGEWTRSGESGRAAATWAAAVGSAVMVSTAFAGPVPDYDFDWAVVGDVDNPAFADTYTVYPVYGRGSVGYRYRISTYEVTTAQWMEFVNTFATQTDDMTFFARPSFWGARRDYT